MGAALQSPACPTLPRPPHPTARFVTIAIRPFFRVGWRELVEMICPTTKAEYFSRDGWTGNSDLPVRHLDPITYCACIAL
jgi:hypothetical protein